MPDECTVAFTGRLPVPGGLDQLLPQEQDGYYPSHWRVNQSVLQQVRQLVGLMERAGDGMDAPAVANREILLCNYWCCYAAVA